MANAFIGNVGELDEQKEDWKRYQKRIEVWFTVNEIALRKRPCTLLALIGAKAFAVVHNLCLPVKPEDKTFKDVCTWLSKHMPV